MKVISGLIVAIFWMIITGFLAVWMIYLGIFLGYNTDITMWVVGVAYFINTYRLLDEAYE